MPAHSIPLTVAYRSASARFGRFGFGQVRVSAFGAFVPVAEFVFRPEEFTATVTVGFGKFRFGRGSFPCVISGQ